jgi:iron complex outermembrane receptor protein
MKSLTRVLLAALLSTIATPASAGAQAMAPDLARVSIEDLMNIEITSASRKEQRAIDTAAAVSVITQDDIRRSGMRTLPELFRLIPGMQVAQINANNWAISARGFNDLWSNKLLVLVDGQSIYTRQFSGVFWRDQDLVLDDIDRIEVVRGAGGSVWGANAVNGVINIVTKSSSETKGPLARLSGGSFDGAQASMRYGGSLGNTSYRIYSQWSDHGTSLDPQLSSAGDRWRRFTNGFRTDWTTGANAVTTQGNFVSGSSRPLWTGFTGPTPSLSGITPSSDDTVGNGTLMARWTHSAANGASLQVQSFADFRGGDDGDGGSVVDDKTFDVDMQFHTKLSARNDVVVGGGYRHVDTTFNGTFAYSLSPIESKGNVLNMFAQDEIALTDRVALTLGSKLERDTISGWAMEPTARVLAKLGSRQRLWGAVSQARRTPSLGDLYQRINYAAFIGATGFPVVLGLKGNPDYHAERFLDVEGGYRLDIGSNASIDVTIFRGDYHGLPTNEPMTPVLETTPGPPHLFIGTTYANLLDASTSGVEVAGHWAPTSVWRLDGSYTGIRLVRHVDASSRDAQAALSDGNAPAHQWQVRTSLWLGSRMEVNAGLYHVGALRTLTIPAYTRADARAEVKITQPLALVVAGQNLLDRAHAEWATTEGVTATLIPRSITVSLVWRR